MSEHRSTAGSATCGGGPEIARLLAAVESQWPSMRERGIACDRDSLISAAACGLVERVWRNSPVEEAHGFRRGPSDGEMMAESLDLYAVARSILDRDDTWPFLEFEDYVLELDRPWSGTSRTVKDMLFGHAGKFRQHVKDEVNRLGWIDEAAGR